MHKTQERSRAEQSPAVRVALVGDVALEVIAPYFRKAGYEVYVPAGFGAWRQELLDRNSALAEFRPDFVFDVTSCDAALLAEVEGFYDERMRRLASMPYSLDGIGAIVEEFGYFRLAAPKKVLAVDADNTLWRGIISEDGMESVAPCTAFQRGLLSLAADGVALVLLSKNDDFEFRADMPLRRDSFAAVKTNWGPKAGNLLAACAELNLGVDSVAFLDDNPFERAQMAAHLPEVTVLPWGGWGDPSREEAETRALLRRLRQHFFSGAGATAEDRLRSADYAARRRERGAREAAEAAGTLADYLVGLELRAAPRLAKAEDLDRLAQMAAKTNQFNLTTIRRSRDDFAALLSDPARRVYVFSTRDRFGEQGIVCYVVADLSSRRITDFVTSCRAMGRTLEHFAYDYVARALGFAPQLDFRPTPKNAPAGKFLAALRSGHGATYYRQW